MDWEAAARVRRWIYKHESCMAALEALKNHPGREGRFLAAVRRHLNEYGAKDMSEQTAEVLLAPILSMLTPTDINYGALVIMSAQRKKRPGSPASSKTASPLKKHMDVQPQPYT